MILKNFYLGIIFQIILLTLTCGLTAFFSFRTNLVSVPFHFIIIICIQVYLLIRYVNSVNRTLKNFLFSTLNDDSSFRLSNQFNDKSFRDLNIVLKKYTKRHRILERKRK